MAHRLKADALVAEVNLGGDMARAACAGRSRYSVANRAHDARQMGARRALEDEMCDFGMGGLSSGRSPDRLDALVWAVTDLITRGPRVRMLGGSLLVGNQMHDEA